MDLFFIVKTRMVLKMMSVEDLEEQVLLLSRENKRLEKEIKVISTILVRDVAPMYVEWVKRRDVEEVVGYV